jgi:hypothetical protein
LPAKQKLAAQVIGKVFSLQGHALAAISSKYSLSKGKM